MLIRGWRTVFVQTHTAIGMTEGCLCLRQEGDVGRIPLEQIRSVVIEAQEVSISAAALRGMTEHGISLIICDAKHNPQSELVPLHGHTSGAGNLMKQTAWTQSRKDALWEEIVRQKLFGQMGVLEALRPGSSSPLTEMLEKLAPGDSGNCEATGAEIYFRSLFGKRFSRRTEDPVNAALNYGYAILLSTVNKAVSCYGYKSELGVHHCSQVNPFNLACDLMEPFRPLIDSVVLSMELDEDGLTAADRKTLLTWVSESVSLGGYHYSAHDAIGLFVKDCIDYMNGDTDKIREVGLLE